MHGDPGHSRAIGSGTTLYRKACFQTEVTEMRWDADDARWIISTNRGDRMRAHFVCMPTGPSTGQAPGIPGLESFEGTPSTQPLGYNIHRRRFQREPHRPHGKRVGIIGKVRRRAVLPAPR